MRLDESNTAFFEDYNMSNNKYPQCWLAEICEKSTIKKRVVGCVGFGAPNNIFDDIIKQNYIQNAVEVKVSFKSIRQVVLQV